MHFTKFVMIIMDSSKICRYTLLLRSQLPQHERVSESTFRGEEIFLILSNAYYILPAELSENIC